MSGRIAFEAWLGFRAAVLIAILVLCSCGQVQPARAEGPPAGRLAGDPAAAARSDWYRSLRQPSGVSCCDESDCAPTRYRWAGDHWEAWLGPKWQDGPNPGGERWVAIPKEVVIAGKHEEEGRAVLCAHPVSQVIFCFVPPVMGN